MSRNLVKTLYLQIFSDLVFFRLELDIHCLDLFPSPQPRFNLESDPMCGITTGGREECFWNCEVGSSGLEEGLFKGFLLTPPDCLLGCFSKV